MKQRKKKIITLECYFDFDESDNIDTLAYELLDDDFARVLDGVINNAVLTSLIVHTSKSEEC